MTTGKYIGLGTYLINSVRVSRILLKTLFWTKLETLHKSQDKKIRKKRVAKSKAMLQCYTTPMHNTASMMKMQWQCVELGM